MHKSQASVNEARRQRLTAVAAVVVLWAASAPIQAQDEAAAEPASTAEEALFTLPPSPLEARIEFERLTEEGALEEAIELAEHLLALTIAENGETSTATGQAQLQLADAQRRAERYDDAEISYLNAIETFRTADGPFSELMIDPSIGLGDTYHADGQYMNAISAYNEARTIQRRANGLLNEDQIPIMDRMTESLQAMSMFIEADEQQQAALTLVERIYGTGSVESLQAIYKYARWLRSAYLYFGEREQYERAIRIIRAEHGKDDPLLVEPWRGIGNSYREQSLEDPRGASALNSARELLENLENPDPVALAQTLTDIGDWKTAFGPAGSGADEYLAAWNLLATAPDGDNLRADWFARTRPRIVYQERFSSRGLAQNPNDPDARSGHVLLRFDIDPFGRTENVEILESVPPGFKDDAAARSVRLSRFRPQIENGEFVLARSRAYMITFSYMSDDED